MFMYVIILWVHIYLLLPCSLKQLSSCIFVSLLTNSESYKAYIDVHKIKLFQDDEAYITGLIMGVN